MKVSTYTTAVYEWNIVTKKNHFENMFAHIFFLSGCFFLGWSPKVYMIRITFELKHGLKCMKRTTFYISMFAVTAFSQTVSSSGSLILCFFFTVCISLFKHGKGAKCLLVCQINSFGRYTYIERQYLLIDMHAKSEPVYERQVDANEHVLMHTNHSIFQIVIIVIIINRMTRRFEYVLASNKPFHGKFAIILSFCKYIHFSLCVHSISFHRECTRCSCCCCC